MRGGAGRATRSGTRDGGIHRLFRDQFLLGEPLQAVGLAQRTGGRHAGLIRPPLAGDNIGLDLSELSFEIVIPDLHQNLIRCDLIAFAHR